MSKSVHRACPFFFLCLLPIVGCGQPPGPGSFGALPPAGVTVALPITRAVTDYEDFPGRIEAVDSVELRARVTGHLDKVHFREGAEVKEGDLLLEIDSRTYQATYDLNKAMVAQNEASVKLAAQNAARAEMLANQKDPAISQAELDQARSQLVQNVATLNQSKANLETARLNLSFTKVRAPLSGRISRKLITPGNMVKENETALTTIVSLDPIYAYFDLDERTTLRLQKLTREGKFKWVTDSSLSVSLGLADEKGYPREGKIDFADNRVEPDTGTWQLRAVFNNADRSLSPGLFVRVRLPIGGAYNALLISEQALGTDQGQRFVYVVEQVEKSDETGTKTIQQVAYRRVKVGRLHGGLRVITEGLKSGDRVVVNGLQRVRPGAEVVPQQLDRMPVVDDGKE